MVRVRMTPATQNFYRACSSRSEPHAQLEEHLARDLPNSWWQVEYLEVGGLDTRPFLSMKARGKRSLVFLPRNWEVV